MTKMLEKYWSLLDKVDRMVDSGRNPLEPVIRSMERQLAKIYRALTPEERVIVDLGMADPIPY